MQIETDESLLLKCRSDIEAKLGWGPSDSWATQDFESLRGKILEATGTDLSVNTLKRIWGKIRYESKPTLTTLNALAHFLGHENWRVFQQSHSSSNGIGHKNGEVKTPPPIVETNAAKGKRIIQFGIAGVLIAAGLAWYFLLKENRGTKKIDPQRFEFSSKKVVSEGVPNSVIFDYDASAADPSDSVFIQQSWDKRLRQLVLREQHLHTSIYYYPGLFQAKLIVNDQIAKEHNLFIKTIGWLPVVEQKPVPVYFKEEDVRHNNGSLGLPIEKLRENTISLQPVTPWTSYYNVRDFGDLKSDDFIFETEVKNDFKEGAGACQHTEVHLQFEGGALVIPLSIKGCVSELKFLKFNGKETDLSVLGCDFTDWAKVIVKVSEGTGAILVNGKEAYKISKMIMPPVKIIGVLYRFQGTGSVNSVKMSRNNGEIIYEDNF